MFVFVTVHTCEWLRQRGVKKWLFRATAVIRKKIFYIRRLENAKHG